MVKIVNIPGFGEKYCSDNTEYQLFGRNSYAFYKKGTYILHNEYGPAYEVKTGDYQYFVNNRRHRLSGYAVIINNRSTCQYYILGWYRWETKASFIKNLADTLIPRF